MENKLVHWKLSINRLTVSEYVLSSHIYNIKVCCHTAVLYFERFLVQKIEKNKMPAT